MVFDSTFLEVINQVAVGLTESLTAELETILSKVYRQPTEQWEYSLADALPSRTLRQKVHILLNYWQQTYPNIQPQSIYLALLSSQQLHQQLQKEYEVQPIWTIPKETGEWPRRTEQTILKLIAQTQKELLIICFAVYNVPQIVSALQEALERGVTVRLIVELPEAAQKISVGVFQTFPPDLLEKMDIYYWPKSQRPLGDKGQIGSLHIKGIVSDQTHLFVSSANLTQSALQLNLELGLLTKQPLLAQQITDTIDHLLCQHILCPIPSYSVSI
ncbi:DISARM system phospholipase D-like protein DrmC [Spirulina subsalsa FACHB-351]|uniref:DISARM system phospholipase D-like protein DrmC n=1 Tax=Spirulina subsalsa FACHB-351 TaxID=234711 RepID=A0ABT3LBV1_9CYAN|nr:DISARM system phospholipase D-like protein DrmC [Spirulina subsalsa]MCW6038990.1 DISARM system phospholipase D-like protein DrmC [Spirulina subsalsa FACHB-351]